MGFIFFLLFLIVIVGSIAIYYIYVFNKLMDFKSKMEQAESIIDEELRNKFDLIRKMDAVLESLLKQDKSFFKDITRLEKENFTNFDFDRKLVEYENIINQLKQDYPEIKDDKEYRKMDNDFRDINEKLVAAKAYYNKYTNKSNEVVRKFPGNIIAKLHDVDIKPFFDGKNMQDDIIDDFKL